MFRAMSRRLKAHWSGWIVRERSSHWGRLHAPIGIPACHPMGDGLLSGSKGLAMMSGFTTFPAIRRDGAEITPAGLSDGVQLTLESDDGPIYLVGDITVASVE